MELFSREGSHMKLLRITAAVLAVLILTAGGAAAQEKPLYFYGGLGYAKALNDGAPGGSIGFHGGLIYRMQNSPLAIGGEVGYLMLGKEEEGDFEATWSTIPITGQVYYVIPTEGTMMPFLTGGLGFYNTKVEADYTGPLGDLFPSVETSNTDLGINLGAGFKMGSPDSAVQFGADGRFHIIMTEDESTNVVTLMGRVYF